MNSFTLKELNLSRLILLANGL